MSRLLLMLILVISLNIVTPIAQAALQGLVWTAVKELAVDTAIDAVQDFFKESISPEEIKTLQKQVAELEQQLKQKQQSGDYPSQQEFNSIQNLVTSLKTLLNQFDKQFGKVEERVSQVESELAQIRQSLQTVSSQSSKTGLDFSIRYVYRHGQQGTFKPLNEGDVLQSGDFYKIIVTPKQDSYLYIFQLDGANKLYRLFPMDRFKGVQLGNVNPVKANQTYYLPKKNKSFTLDKQTGTEKLYLLASAQADVVLENQAQILQLDKPATQNQLLTTIKQKKGLGEIVDDVNTVETWREDEQTFSVSMQRLQDLCNGCVHVLSFEHR